MANRLMLRDLLLLEVGATDFDNAAQIRADIEQNQNCKRVWELVQRVSAELKPGRRTSERLTQVGFDLDSQIVAAYLDGTLERDQQKELEREAIRTPRMLQELLLHFREQFSEPSDCLVPWSATEKLFQLAQDDASYAAIKPRASRSAPIVSGYSQTSGFAKPLGIQMAQAVGSAGSRKRVSRSRTWAIAVVGVATASVCGAIWITGGLSGWTSRSVKGTQYASVESEPTAGSAGVTSAGTLAPDAVDSIAIKSRGNVTQPSAGTGDWVLVALEEPGQSEATDGGTGLDLNASVFHQQSSVLADLDWLKLEGVVALREKGKETWFGPRSSSRVFNGLEWQTLSDSWVSARLGKLGEIVLDADSSVAVSVLAEERLIGLEMQAGRIGLKRLPAQSKLKVKYDQVEWNIEVLSAGAVLGFDWLDGSPRLSVYRGSVRTNEQEVSGNQQLVWVEKPKSELSSRSNLLSLSPLSDSFAWLDSPAKVNALSETDQAELLASANVVSSLNRLEANRSRSERVLAQYLPAVLSPELHLLDVLEGSEQKSREEALRWLMGLSPRSPKTRQLWRTIAEKSNAPDETREFFRLLQLARNSAPVSELDARFLTNGLRHDRLFVREMSQLLLEYGFGNTARYDAAAEPATRNPAAERWTREILQSYKPNTVPKR